MPLLSEMKNYPACNLSASEANDRNITINKQQQQQRQQRQQQQHQQQKLHTQDKGTRKTCFDSSFHYKNSFLLLTGAHVKSLMICKWLRGTSGHISSLIYIFLIGFTIPIPLVFAHTEKNELVKKEL